MTDRPWEPPLAGSDAEQVVGALDRQRWTFRYKVDDLNADGLRQRVGASTLTLGRLTKHLALVEDHYFHARMSGDPLPSVWDANAWDDDPDWELTSADDDEPATLYRLYDAAVARSRARLAERLVTSGLDQEVHAAAEGRHANLRRMLLDLVEEYGRHTGHADLIREAVDGRTGEDPPDGWRPVS